MIGRFLNAGLRLGRVAGDEVHGGNPKLRSVLDRVAGSRDSGIDNYASPRRVTPPVGGYSEESKYELRAGAFEVIASTSSSVSSWSGWTVISAESLVRSRYRATLFPV